MNFGGMNFSRKALLAVVCTAALALGAMGCIGNSDPNLPPPTPQEQATRILNRVDGVITLVETNLALVIERKGGDPEKYADAVFFARVASNFARGVVQIALADLQPLSSAGAVDTVRLEALNDRLGAANETAAEAGIEAIPTLDPAAPAPLAATQ